MPEADLPPKSIAEPPGAVLKVVPWIVTGVLP